MSEVGGTRKVGVVAILKNPYVAQFTVMCMGRAACPKIAHVEGDCEKLRGVREVLTPRCSACDRLWPAGSEMHERCYAELPDGREVKAWRVFRLRMADGSIEEFEYELPVEGNSPATAIEIPWM